MDVKERSVLSSAVITVSRAIERAPEGPRVNCKVDYNVKGLCYLEAQTDQICLYAKRTPGTSLGQRLNVKGREGQQKPYSISLTQRYAGTATEASPGLSFW